MPFECHPINLDQLLVALHFLQLYFQDKYQKNVLLISR